MPARSWESAALFFGGLNSRVCLFFCTYIWICIWTSQLCYDIFVYVQVFLSTGPLLYICLLAGTFVIHLSLTSNVGSWTYSFLYISTSCHCCFFFVFFFWWPLAPAVAVVWPPPFASLTSACSYRQHTSLVRPAQSKSVLYSSLARIGSFFKQSLPIFWRWHQSTMVAMTAGVTVRACSSHSLTEAQSIMAPSKRRALLLLLIFAFGIKYRWPLTIYSYNREG